ncbi:fluconazole resistance protein 1 [[Candida] jaroonii]|uniref:Fluconazole resistance protein 1 n=1 Tax=[Candida] jaroonii TaxID=467808 RepID=A0ACA9Y546_9ASCO|nr:fluconazole resistance protein 1 [[Candida] jaroonii]
MGISIFVRDSFWGRLIYHLSSHKYFYHKEESLDYVIPDKYLQKVMSVESDNNKAEVNNEQGVQLESDNSGTTSSDERIIVTWDGEDDPNNPKNWPMYLKVLIIIQVCFLTIVVYMSSAIFTPGIEVMMEDLKISRVEATLPMTMFVIGYGIGPMFLSPMSESAVFGRTNIYIITLFLFFILQIPISIVNNIGGLAVLRFFSGIVASPSLATGAASMGDITKMPYLPITIAIWSVSAVCGPSLGPIFGSVLVIKRDWHWTFWLIAMTSGISLIIFSICLPETFEKTLLLRKARRLRKVTGNPNIVSEGELENENLNIREMTVDILWRPFEISFFEPVVLLINIYIALIYSMIYLWFEAFPIAYLETYHFTLVTMGVAYMSVAVGVFVGASIYVVLIYKKFIIPFFEQKPISPETFIPIMIVGSIIMPMGIFVFGWTVSPDTHWIGSMIGAGLFSVGSFITFQSSFLYLANSFPRYLASVFAGNALFRSDIAAVFPLFGDALFNNLATEKFPVGWGSSVIAFICVGMILVPVLFYLNGPKLRARSKYSGFHHR